MADTKYTPILDMFHQRLKTEDVFEQFPVILDGESQIVFKDTKDELSLSQMPIAKIKKTIGLSTSSTYMGKPDPVGDTNYKVEYITPLYQNLTMTVTADEMDFYASAFDRGNKDMFIEDKLSDLMFAYNLYTNNLRNQAFTASIDEQVREESGSPKIVTGNTINFGTLIQAVDTADVSGTFDISDASMTKEQFFNFLEELRLAKKKKEGNTRFNSVNDLDTFCASNIFSIAFGLITGQQTGNAIMAQYSNEVLNIGGYRLHNKQAPFSKFAKGAKDVWAPVEQDAVATSYIQMIDTARGRNMQRNLRVATTDGRADRLPYSIVINEMDNKKGWQIDFSAKPCVIFDTTASLSRKIKA